MGEDFNTAEAEEAWVQVSKLTWRRLHNGRNYRW
jgi:hypothetical protein